MIKRNIQQTLLELVATYPVIAITGPRQSGKTTLAQMAFPGYQYCNLENPEIRMMAEQDPQSFFRLYPAPIILDEIQRVPTLLSYIQSDVDQTRKNGQYILTGSQHLGMNEVITQSLAGRTALLTLLPFSLDEASGYYPSGFSVDILLYKGFMPRIYD